MNKPIEKMSAKELLKLPERSDNKYRPYISILLVPSRLKHDSGYMKIAIVGCWRDPKGETQGEICAYPDDICWNTDASIAGDECGLRTDCFYPSGVMQVWSRRVMFHVEHAFSSTEIKMMPLPS